MLSHSVSVLTDSWDTWRLFHGAEVHRVSRHCACPCVCPWREERQTKAFPQSRHLRSFPSVCSHRYLQMCVIPGGHAAYSEFHCTVRVWVTFEMFTLLESLSTLLKIMVSLPSVCPRVCFQVWWTLEGPPTLRTFIGSLSSVCPNVYSQVLRGGEGFLAVLTFIGPLPSVCPHMYL